MKNSHKAFPENDYLIFLNVVCAIQVGLMAIGHLLPPLPQPPAADQSPLLAEHQVVQQEGLVEWNQLAGMKERSYSIISFEKIYSLVKVCSPAI